MIKGGLDLILQGGCGICPICNSKFKWHYTLVKTERYTPEEGQQTHYTPFCSKNCNGHIVTANGKVRFIILCSICKSQIETESMELISKDNYENYREDEINNL